VSAAGPARRADILHLDMDCFFAAVEVLDDPALAGRPVIVGGVGNRGVVSSASYEARGFGVHSAMPTAEARRLCPTAHFLSPRHDRYGEVSAQLLELLHEVTPVVEPISVDEAFLDISGAHRIAGPSHEIADALRRTVREQLGLDCAVGGGSSKLVAKLASKAAKPEIAPEGPRPGLGVLIVDPAEELAFIHGHAVRAIPGIGPRTAEKLARLGIRGVGELAALPVERLVSLFGKRQGAALAALANGIDERPVEPNRGLRSIGHEETFDRDVTTLVALEGHARRQSESVAARCRRAELFGRTVQVKLKFADFTTITRSRTAGHRVTSAAEIAEIAVELLGKLEWTQGVRLLGVSVANLESGEEARQLALFAEDGAPAMGHDQRKAIESVTDSIRERFGSDAISAASTLADGARGLEGRHRG